MDDRSLHVTQAEFAVLEVLWNKRTATIRQIVDEIYPEATSSQYATVQKLLDRLEGKNIVHRDSTSFAHVFSAAIERADLVDSDLQAVADKLCEGSLTPLLLHLVKRTNLSVRERDELRQLLDDHQSNSKKRGRKS